VTPTFRRFAGAAALLAAGVSVVYTVTFALYVHDGSDWAHWASAIALTISGLVVTPVFIALHSRLRDAEPEFSMLALVIGVFGALGATIHGAFDVANLAKPLPGSSSDLPSHIDPRGFLTFAFTGVALALFGWLAARTARLPKQLWPVGALAALMLLVVYFGRLISFDPHRSYIKYTAALAGVLVLPVFYLLVARALLTSDTA
jgi:drug/metabolite transporter (DMT)-like permease